MTLCTEGFGSYNELMALPFHVILNMIEFVNIQRQKEAFNNEEARKEADRLKVK